MTKSKIEQAIVYGAKAAALRQEVDATDQVTDETEHLALVGEFYGLLSETFATEAGEEET
ncbi:hypothetical protein [Caulobacter hibisci]|uniref:Uncharacterized protein n=1 Tax=Caulobacter hibisci TaxID=2035993 RepID=A0ABS0ST17_9CAUL|nr:hypothetical protein [Caulobacter hibisci]MBI1682351.1 hypothetical protein [Caulobacter hibisci]